MTMAAIAIGGSAVIGYMGQQSAASAAQGANQQNIQAQQQWNQQQDPFSAGGNRAQYVPQLNELMKGGPAGVAQDPMFQKMNEQSLTNVQRREQASGQGGSGQEMLALQNQGFGNQMDYFNQQYSRLADLSGASRGGGQAAMGQSPGAAFGQSRQGSQDIAASFGGLSSIFGQGAGAGGGGYGTGEAGGGSGTNVGMGGMPVNPPPIGNY
jgi:hypothetical protein